MKPALSPSSPRALLILFMAACLAVLPAGAWGQQARDVRSKPAGGTAILGGTVTSHDESTRPLRRVIVTLSGAAGSGDLQVVTDEAGRFVFSQLPAGRYTLTADKPAFVKTYYGSKRPGRGPATPIALADGQRVTDIAIRVLRGAVIEGTVIDESGVPLSSLRSRCGSQSSSTVNESWCAPSARCHGPPQTIVAATASMDWLQAITRFAQLAAAPPAAGRG